MNLTNIFRFRKPEGTDPVNVEDFNDNFDVIDTELNKRPEKTGNASDMVTTFSQAASRANLTPGEKISVSFGKIMKFFADLKAVAFTGSYADLSNKPSIPGGAAASQAVANNCTTTAAGSVLDARQGKVLMDKANQINSDLTNLKDDIPDPPVHLYQTSIEVSVSAGTWKNNNMPYTNKSGRMCLVFYDVLFSGSGEIHVSTTNSINQSDRGSSGGESNRHVSICAPLSPDNSIGCNVWASVSGTFTIKIQIIRL